MDENWQIAAREDEFPAEGKLATELGGWSVLIVRTDDGYQAVNDRCTHQSAKLSPGRVRRGAIMCPLHGARFEVATGRCVGGAYPDLRLFPLRIEGGVIEVAVPAAAPGPHERPTGI